MGDGKRILIVDDEEKVAFFLQESLEGMDRDYEVVSVETGEQALEEVRRRPFDLVVTDLRMPGINGLELMERLQQVSPAIPIILITAYGSDEVEDEAQRLRAYRYFVKPFHIEDFTQTVQEALQEMTARRRGLLALSG